MKKEIIIGPIQRRESQRRINLEVRKQINKMKLGEFFEMTGMDNSSVNNVRAAISYFSKRDGFKVTTEYSTDRLTIERVRK